MCGHEFMYRNLYHLQRHRPVWRCGTCGRESYVPLDCCTRPAVAPRQSVTLGRRCAQGLAATGRWTLTSLWALLGWYRRPVALPADSAAEGGAAMPVGVGVEDAKTAVAADELVAAGEPV
jgi:hypothetical protein